MKKTLYPIIPLLAVISFWILYSVPANGQESPAPVTMEMTTWKYADGSRTLVAKVTTAGETGEVPATLLGIKYFSVTDKGENLLGSMETGADGKAVLTLGPSVKPDAGKDGVLKFIARFEGNQKFEASEAETAVKDARIEIGFAEIDSVRKITFRGVLINDKGEESPLANTDIYLFVPRMFSMLKIQDGWLGEDGTGESDFPADLTGDSLGMVKVYARIEESADYGNLEASGETGWAQQIHHEKREGPMRELWTPIAPMWMIITLIIMLAGVWGHYIYAIVQLVLINKAGKVREEKKE